ncbi:MAG: DUF2855 family protein [Actinomycetes bacterium]
MDIEVRRTELATTRRVESSAADLEEGQALFRIDTFGLSMNNVSFGVTGEMLGYWKLFPASGDGWGRITVFGFADVVESRHPDVEVGTRVFGYLPMSNHLVVEPARVNERGFFDGSTHRRDVIAPVWNHYQSVSSDSPQDRAHEAQRSLLGPLFVTGYLIDDFIDDNAAFGADTIVVSTSSSKTAIAAAFCIARRGGRQLVGLTAPERVEFVSRLGLYDLVLSYDDLANLPGQRAIYVDFSGVMPLREAIHDRYGNGLVHSMVAGMSHVDDAAGLVAPKPAVGANPEVFMAPLQVQKRAKDWGQSVFDSRRDAAWELFVAFTDDWLTITSDRGVDAVEGAWQALVRGDVDPASGYQLTMWP